MVKQTLSVLFLFFFFFPAGVAQTLHVDSTRFITGTQCCTGIGGAIPTVDKGILFVGGESNNPGGIIPGFPLDAVYGNVLIGKIDSNQQISWLKVYGGSQNEGAGNVCQTADGGYAVLASTGSGNGDITGFKGGTDIWLLRIDAFGNLLWGKCYGSTQSEGAMSIASTPDNGFIILGSSNGSDGDVPFHYGSGFLMDWLVIKTDSLGNKQWSKDIGGSEDESEYGSIISADGGYYLVSSTISTDHDCTDTAWHKGVNTLNDFHVIRLDTLGNLLWDSSYGGSGNDIVNYAMFDGRDSTIVITGGTMSTDYMVPGGHSEGDMWVIKINKNGTLLWQKTFGTPSPETGNSVCYGPDGGYIAFGGTNGIIGFSDNWVVYTDSNGNEISERVFGGTDHEYARCILPYHMGYVAAGASTSDFFTEGTTYGNFNPGSGGGGACVSYLHFSPVFLPNTDALQRSITGYPNPTKNKIQIRLPGNENGSLHVYDMTGREMSSVEVGEQTRHLEINVSTWSSGVYILKWNNENGDRLTAKFTKN